MPFKTCFTALKKKWESSEASGDVPSKLFNWRGRIPSVPPLSTRKAMEYVRGAWAQRCQFVKTVGVAGAWGFATNFVWGRRNDALSNPQPLKFVFLPRILVTLFIKIHKA